MRKLLIIALTFASINIAAGQVWAQYDFQVESGSSSQNNCASNELMSSDFAKENLKGSVHLDVYISNGSSSATFFCCSPTKYGRSSRLDDGLQTSPEGQKFYSGFELKLNCGKRENKFVYRILRNCF